MHYRFLTGAAAAACFFASAALAGDPAGSYDVAGKNPDGKGSYSGTATVVKTGETYKVTWNIGGSVYVGTALGDAKFLAVSYRAGDSSGLALYGADGDDWAGVWTYQNGKKLGAEMWKRQ